MIIFILIYYACYISPEISSTSPNLLNGTCIGTHRFSYYCISRVSNSFSFALVSLLHYFFAYRFSFLW